MDYTTFLLRGGCLFQAYPALLEAPVLSRRRFLVVRTVPAPPCYPTGSRQAAHPPHRSAPYEPSRR